MKRIKIFQLPTALKVVDDTESVHCFEDSDELIESRSVRSCATTNHPDFYPRRKVVVNTVNYAPYNDDSIIW